MKLIAKILMIVALLERAGYTILYFILYANPNALARFYPSIAGGLNLGDITITSEAIMLFMAIESAVLLVAGAIIFPFAWKNISKPKMGDHSIALGVLTCLFLSIYAGILYILAYSFERRYEQMMDPNGPYQNPEGGTTPPPGYGYYGSGTMNDSVQEAKVEEPEDSVMSEDRKAALLEEREALSRQEEELRAKLNSFPEIEESRVSAAKIASLKEEIAQADGEAKSKLEWTLSDEREHLRHIKSDLERKRAPLMKERDEVLGKIKDIDRQLNS